MERKGQEGKGEEERRGQGARETRCRGEIDCSSAPLPLCSPAQSAPQLEQVPAQHGEPYQVKGARCHQEDGAQGWCKECDKDVD